MNIRTSRRTVTFGRPFTLESVDEVLPAGVYTVETDEASLGTMSFLAWRRVATRLHLHAKPGGAVVARLLTIDPNELDAALERDQARAGPSADVNLPQEKPARKRRQQTMDRQAVERGENEGMMTHPAQTRPRREKRDLVRQGQDRLKQLMPSGSPSWRRPTARQ